MYFLMYIINDMERELFMMFVMYKSDHVSHFIKLSVLLKTLLAIKELKMKLQK